MEANLARKYTTSVTVIFVKCKITIWWPSEIFLLLSFEWIYPNEPVELGPVKFRTEVVHTRTKCKYGEGADYSGYIRQI
jgi:hypothetical protein